MTHCLPRCCTGCRTELRDKQKAQREDSQWINACCAGPLPAFMEDTDDEDKPNSRSNSSADEPLKEGDRIWVTGLLPKPEYIRASSMISQQLVEAFKQNSKPQTTKNTSPCICVISTLSSPKNPLMTSWSLSPGIMPSNSSPTWLRRVVRCTCLPLWSRRN